MTISRTEFEQRLERLRGRMQRRGIDAVVLGTGMNLRYFTGYPSPAINVVRPFFAVLPLHSEPCFLTHTAHAFEAKRYAWIADVRSYEKLSECPAAPIGDALREAGAKRIGLELGFEQTCSLSPAQFMRLREGLGGSVVEDIAAELWALRSIKSDAEIGCMRKACGITADAYSQAFRRVAAGVLESDIYGEMRRGMLEAGAGDLFLAITSGEGNYNLVTKLPEARAIAEGEMVWMDAGCTVDGYWSDYSRARTAGISSGEQERAQEAVVSITRRTIERIRPGVRASQLARFALNCIDELPFPITSNLAALAGRIGHGVGLSLTEPPHLSTADETVLEAGMVVSVEPGVATRYGTFHVEENVLVTDDGFEVLSNCSRELQA